MPLPNARQVASAAISAAKLPLKAAGLAGALAGIGLELLKDSYRQRAESKRIRLIDRRRGKK